tara:strand:+ start:706 stop:1011 length:306 start_codon:yes stop_codon:yes gene_type:complete
VALEPEDTLVTEVTGAMAMDTMALAAAALDYSEEELTALPAAARLLLVLAEEEEGAKRALALLNVLAAADQEALRVLAVVPLVLVEHLGVVPVGLIVALAI